MVAPSLAVPEPVKVKALPTVVVWLDPALATGAVCADWLMVMVCPATVSVPVRLPVEALAATEYATLPLPVPLEPDVIVIQEAPLLAVQLEAAVTPTLPLPPPAPYEALAGETLTLSTVTLML